MNFTAQQVADLIQGQVEGDKSVVVNSFSKIEEGSEGTLSFLANAKYVQYLTESKASVILVDESLNVDTQPQATLIRVRNPYQAFAFLLNYVEQAKPQKTGISDLAYIAPTAVIEEGAYIAPFVYLGEGVRIGKNVKIHAHVCIEDNVIIGDNVTIFGGANIYHSCQIGNRCILHSGVVIGSDGFGFAKNNKGEYDKIPQIGNVVLEDDVEIGANTVIDRATLGSTIIRKGVKLDNLIQIAHNCEVGEHTVIASQTGVSGSTKIGKKCTIAGQVGIAGHIQIADGTLFGAQSGVPNTIKEPNQMLMGTPVVSMRNFQRSAIVYKQLPELQKLVAQLEKRLDELEKK